MTDQQVFDFMIKEYELLYSKFEMHYNAVEKTITIYLIVAGGILSANGFLIEDTSNISIFGLNEFQLVCSIFVSIIGFFTVMRAIEHRILIISYVKSVNLNRKWFLENASGKHLEKYMFYKADPSRPKYYKPFRHFFWEVLGLSAITSIFWSITILNLLILFGWQSKYHEIVNRLALIALYFTFIFFILLIYRIRGRSEEKKV